MKSSSIISKDPNISKQQICDTRGVKAKKSIKKGSSKNAQTLGTGAGDRNRTGTVFLKTAGF